MTFSSQHLRESVQQGLIVSYNGTKVVASHAYFIFHESKEYSNSCVHAFMDRKNKQWMTLKFNSSILIILNARNEIGLSFPIQAYGRAEILDDITVLDSFKILERETLKTMSEFERNGFAKKYIGFEILLEKTEEVQSLKFSLPV